MTPSKYTHFFNVKTTLSSAADVVFLSPKSFKFYNPQGTTKQSIQNKLFKNPLASFRTTNNSDPVLRVGGNSATEEFNFFRSACMHSTGKLGGWRRREGISGILMVLRNLFGEFFVRFLSTPCIYIFFYSFLILGVS